MRPLRFLPLLGLALAFLLVAAPHAHAAAGDLDGTFDTDGKVTTEFGGSDQGFGNTVDPQGRILVAGTGGDGVDFIVARYLPTGALDTTFSNDGKKTIDLGADGLGDEEAHDVLVQPNGRIVVVGYTLRGPTSYNFAVVRLLSNGSLDTSFSRDGKTVNDFARSLDTALAAGLDGFGRIVVVGGATTAQFNEGFGIMRYNSNGTLDNTFSGDGKALTNFGSAPEVAFDLVIEPGGKLVLAGYQHVAEQGEDDSHSMAIARFNSSGTLDSSFSGDGRLLFTLGTSSAAFALARQTDGAYLLAGHSEDTTLGDDDYDWVVERVSSSGVQDATYASEVVIGAFDDFANDAVLQPDGKLVIVGATTTAEDGSTASMALARINSDGTPDSGFGTAGVVVTSFGGTVDSWFSVALQTDGDIVTAGFDFVDEDADVAVARYLAA